MTTYTVDVNGTTTPGTPAFPSSIINDILLPDGSVDQTSTTSIVFVDGTFQLQSLFIGSALEVDLGDFSSAALRGTGTITGANDPTKILPAFVSSGIVDINGAVDVAFTSNSQLIVSAGERLDLEGDFSGVSASTVTVASGGESSTTERDTVVATRPDLVSEGIGFYEHTTAQPGDVAIYRFFDANFGTHFYTSSTTERATIIATRPDLTAEGVSFYSPST